MKAPVIKTILFAAITAFTIALMAQATNLGYNPDKVQSPNTKPGSRTQDGMLGVTGTTGTTGTTGRQSATATRGSTGTNGYTGPTGRRGAAASTGKK